MTMAETDVLIVGSGHPHLVPLPGPDGAPPRRRARRPLGVTMPRHGAPPRGLMRGAHQCRGSGIGRLSK
jgi:hypothetical protein